MPAFASRTTHDAPEMNHFTYGQSPYSHLYNQQSHEQRLQIHMASISEKYGREFRAVDERIAGYLGRFLRRAKHGPEQERQLLQVLQVEIRDLLRRTLDSEAEVPASSLAATHSVEPLGRVSCGHGAARGAPRLPPQT